MERRKAALERVGRARDERLDFAARRACDQRAQREQAQKAVAAGIPGARAERRRVAGREQPRWMTLGQNGRDRDRGLRVPHRLGEQRLLARHRLTRGHFGQRDRGERLSEQRIAHVEPIDRAEAERDVGLRGAARVVRAAFALAPALIDGLQRRERVVDRRRCELVERRRRGAAFGAGAPASARGGLRDVVAFGLRRGLALAALARRVRAVRRWRAFLPRVAGRLRLQRLPHAARASEHHVY